MKKFILMMIAVFGITMGASAQYSVTNHRFFDNWSIGVEGGVQTNLHDWNTPQGAVVGLHFDKQITPVYGLTFEGDMGVNNTANWIHPNQPHIHNGNAIDNVAVFALGRVNLMNWWGGYLGKPRVFEVEPFASVGYGHGFVNSTYEIATDGLLCDNDGLLAKAGVNLNFNVGKKRAWTLNLTPSVIYGATNTSHGIGLDCRNAVAQLSAGVTYHFKTSNGTHNFAVVEIPKPIVREVVKEVPVEKVVEKVVEVPVATAAVNNTYRVSFPFDSSELSDTAKGILDGVPTNSTVNVDAYASVEPKTAAEVNQKLSEDRATAVVNYLTNRGVKVSNVTSNGGNDDFGRVAIVTVK